jgi:hypothetical protein
MVTLYWDSPNPLDCWDNPNCRWGSPSYRLEAGDPGYVPWFPPGSSPPPKHPMQTNDIDITITTAQETAILTKIDELRALVDAFAVSLSDTDRASYFKLGDSRMAFDQKCDNYLHQRADLVPGTVDVPAYERDGAASAAVKRIVAKLGTIDQTLADTLILLGADRLAADLAFYNYLPLAAKAGAMGADEIYDDLKATFPGGRRRNPAPTPPQP